MKLPSLKVFSALLLSGVLFAACGGLGKMAKYAETIEYNVDPNPLIVRGDSVALNISGKFPGKYFSKKAEVTLTPVLEYEGGQTAFDSVSFQGEAAAGNNTVIPYETGKSFTYSDKIAYKPAMKNSDVMLHITGRLGNKTKEFEPYKIAEGVITTPLLIMSDDIAIIAGDNFERVTSHDQYAVINYLVNSSYVRPGELRDSDIDSLQALLKEYGKNGNYTFKNAKIVSYASPEGEISLNENLAQERAESAQKAVSNILTRNKVNYEAGNFFQLMPKGEDWEGFKEKMQASNIQDKELILRILEMYPDKVKREQEIRNLAATYDEIAKEILPDLRRSQITLNYEIMGRTDDQITALAKGDNADSLTVEELLYAATLTEDMNEKYAIYEKTAQVYPDDYRAYNNMGVILFKRNELEDANDMFEKAFDMENNAVSLNNRAIVMRRNGGDRKEIYKMLSDATEAGDDVNYNLGVMDVQRGEYSSAIQNMKGKNTFNKALAQLLNGDNEAALNTLNNSPSADTAMGYYLKAVIGARMNNSSMVQENLSKAYALDASLRDMAADDLEFRNYQEQIK